MKKFVFAANEPTYKLFLKYFQLDKNDYEFAASHDTIRGYNHLNSQFILTDGYAVNKCFCSDRYLQCKNWAIEQGRVKTFIIRKMMVKHDT